MVNEKPKFTIHHSQLTIHIDFTLNLGGWKIKKPDATNTRLKEDGRAKVFI
jgi:hypothetical protein